MESDSVEVVAAKKRLEEAERVLALVRRRGHWEYEQEAILAVEIELAELERLSLIEEVRPDLWAGYTLHAAEGRKGGL